MTNFYARMTNELQNPNDEAVCGFSPCPHRA
jgi:hypothetical protein